MDDITTRGGRFLAGLANSYELNLDHWNRMTNSPIRKAAVIGAGTMGAQIAAHLANVGVPSVLLDIAPTELTDDEKAKGFALDSPPVRNRIVKAQFERMTKLKPSPFYLASNANLVTLGNTTDDMAKIADADWIIEAAIERPEVKKEVHAAIDRHRRPGSIVSSNTSGLGIAAMSAGCSDDYRAHFLGTHFFNPPRYMHLLEVIPTAETKPDVLAAISDFGARVLGKGIVRCKDTPYFIGNRIGCFAMSVQALTAHTDGYTIDEVDAITGPPMLRPRSATFRLNDIVGVDLIIDVAKNIYDALPNDEYREVFPAPEFIHEMVRRGLRGAKADAGFYKRIRGASGSEILTLNLKTFEYEPRQKVQFASLDAVKRIADPRERIKALLNADDRAAEYAWKVLSQTLVYAAERAEEISDDLVSIDNAMKWGWNWELGPFEQWDALGVENVVARLEREGRKVPKLARKVVEEGGCFFRRQEAAAGGRRHDGVFRESSIDPEVIDLRELKAAGKTVKSNPDASLVDVGDGVICLEFHNKLNTMGPGLLAMTREAVREVETNFDALIIGNHGQMFSAGANLTLLLANAQNKEWDEINAAGNGFQVSLMAVKCCAKPVVCAPFAQALGGGCEIVLHSRRVQASAELYLGLVELGVGLIPGAGGLKEMTIRSQEHIPPDAEIDRWPFIQRVLQTVGMAKVSTSAPEARELGFLRDHDGISTNPRRLLFEAKHHALSLRNGFQPYRPRNDIPVLGQAGLAKAKLELHIFQRSGYASEYDVHLATKVATVLCGGNLTAPRLVSEQYLLDLERENFISLLGEPKTHERIQHMLKTGKALRN